MPTFWLEFGVLFAFALVGAAALTPFIVRMIKATEKPQKLPLTVLVSIGFLQNAVLFAGVTVLGLITAHAVGLGAPYLEGLINERPLRGDLGSAVSLAAIGGGAAGLFLLLVDLVLLPRIPALLELARSTPLWENFAASFYGGINEELLTRLLGVSGIIWLLNQLPNEFVIEGDTAAWTAIIVMAIAFSVGHIPATKAVAGQITPLIVARTLGLNGPLALFCGWLFWRFGIEAAVIAHFLADIVYHVGGTALLRANDKFRFLGWFPPA